MVLLRVRFPERPCLIPTTTRRAVKLFQCSRKHEVGVFPPDEDHDYYTHAIVSVRTKDGDQREEAKRNAHALLGGDPDKYAVTPLTNFGEQVAIRIDLAQL